ncbi:GGDEF domain-containing protein [Pseudomonas sp.]|uniref:GGDEF domain-containing protein n=1 Tax=Pseudomonas sp. TaxID=306 RepID=UPI0035243B00
MIRFLMLLGLLPTGLAWAGAAVEVTTVDTVDGRLLGELLLVLAVALLTSLFWGLKLRGLQRQLQVRAQTDALTGLATRVALDSRFAICHEQAQRYARPFTLILLDIDHFKRVNDELGHRLGDEVLREFGQLLQECIRGSDGLGRWGGEEFLLLCPETTLEQAVAFAERICARARTYKFASGRQQTLSGGVVELMPGDTLDALLQRAEAALAQAKNQGRDRVCFTANDELDDLPL